MTREEIKQEAEEQVNVCTPYHTGSFIQGYIAAVESWQAKYKKQKEINKELVDENHKLSDCNGRLLDQAGAATKRAIDLETENNKLLDVINNQDVKIADLEQENAELKEQLDFNRDERNYFQEKCEDIELNYYCDHKGGCKAQELETENNKLLDVINNQDVKIADLEKNYKDSLVACGVLKKKVELLAQPSPLESMQDTLITTQKVAYEKQNEQLTKSKEILKMIVNYYPCYNKTITEQAEQFLKEIEK